MAIIQKKKRMKGKISDRCFDTLRFVKIFKLQFSCLFKIFLRKHDDEVCLFNSSTLYTTDGFKGGSS